MHPPERYMALAVTTLLRKDVPFLAGILGALLAVAREPQTLGYIKLHIISCLPELGANGHQKQDVISLARRFFPSQQL